MRSISFSASPISSIESSRTLSARRWYPQLAIILESMKYWLMAVSSAVSTSLRNSSTASLPCISGLPVGGGQGSGGGEIGVGARLLAQTVVGQQGPYRRETSTAGAAGATAAAHRLGIAGAGLDGLTDATVGDRPAVTDVQRATGRPGPARRPCGPSGRRWARRWPTGPGRCRGRPGAPKAAGGRRRGPRSG